MAVDFSSILPKKSPTETRLYVWRCFDGDGGCYGQYLKPVEGTEHLTEEELNGWIEKYAEHGEEYLLVTGAFQSVTVELKTEVVRKIHKKPG